MIKDFFKKDINRTIETVIKADDRDNISDEIAEYVITDEIKKYLATLFEAYNTLGSKVNGVWISGHFGNGKSHLLKILSYVLENKEHEGWLSGEVFAEKIDNDELLKAEVKKAIKSPSESILFNIDQQSQITTKADRNAILSVFYKVFYDHLGYYGFIPHVAEFERWLDKDQQYEAFKKEFDQISNRPWSEARRDYFDPDVEDNVFTALSKIKGKDAERFEDVLINLEDRNRQSIEHLGIIINEYIQSKPADFRLNFFVDEVGQYVGDDVQLMLNLQSIAETLATKTNGRSWIMITSQADIQDLMNWESKGEKDNFGRIQARFAIRIALTASSADEVVQKRLLEKKEEAQSKLEDLYRQRESHLKTLLSFSEVGVQFQTYQDKKDFAEKYPMVPYQFSLFQQCRIGLSKHDAFQGAFSAVGSRSMLGVFQQVIKTISHKDRETLVSFDSMYEGIRSELRGTIQNRIDLAEREIGNAMAVRVLKALFMVKYYDQFKATKRNISTLLIDNQNIDLQKHEEEIDKALLILENQSYIQRNTDFYEYLTDKEKDIDIGIKNTDIDEQAVNQFMKEIFFDDIIIDSRITYLQNKTAYEFSPILNGVPYGRERELKIEIITSDHISDEATVAANSMGTTILKLLLEPGGVFMSDIRLYKKAEKYVKLKMSSTTDSETLRTLQKISTDNNQRKQELITKAKMVLAKSVGFVSGNRIPGNGTQDGRNKVINAFQALVTTVYSNLPMLKNASFSEDTIRAAVHSTDTDLFGDEATNLSEAEKEILTTINLRKSQNERTSINDLKDYLSKRPHGWHSNATLTLIARLFRKGSIELIRNSTTVEKAELAETLLNSSHHANTLITPQATFDIAQVTSLKQVYSDAFNETCPHREAKEVALAFKEKLKEMSAQVELLLAKDNYPFLSSLEKLSDLLSDLTKKDYGYYLNNLNDFEDELLDLKEDYLSPMLSFMNGNQKDIYDDIALMLTRDTGNLNYAEETDHNLIKELINDPKPYRGSKIREAKAAMDRIKSSVLTLIEEERKKALEQVIRVKENISQREEFIKLAKTEQAAVLSSLNITENRIKTERFISGIKQMVNELSYEEVEALNLMQEFINKSKKAEGVSEPTVKYTTVKDIHVPFEKKELKTEQDVEEYAEALKQAFLKKVRDNARITL